VEKTAGVISQDTTGSGRIRKIKPPGIFARRLAAKIFHSLEPFLASHIPQGINAGSG
jgi:hypothetical protein